MIQINVTAKCQATTQRGTPCTRMATKYQGPFCRNDGEATLFVELLDSVHIKKRWRAEKTLSSGAVFPGAWVEDKSSMQGIPSSGFVCNTHARRCRLPDCSHLHCVEATIRDRSRPSQSTNAWRYAGRI